MARPVGTLIVDDVRPARNKLRRLLAETPWELEILEAGSGSEALALAAAEQPRLALLDIRMPGMSGIALAGQLALLPAPPQVIFVTAYKNHALEAFEVGAVDYLLKPVDPAALRRALQRALPPQPAARGSAGSPRPPRTHLLVRTKGGNILLPLEEVIYFRADSKYVSARTGTDGHLISEPLAALEREFGSRFLRVHRNTLASTRHLAGLHRNDETGAWTVSFRGIDDRLRVSRRYRPALRRWLRRHAG